MKFSNCISVFGLSSLVLWMSLLNNIKKQFEWDKKVKFESFPLPFCSLLSSLIGITLWTDSSPSFLKAVNWYIIFHFKIYANIIIVLTWKNSWLFLTSWLKASNAGINSFWSTINPCNIFTLRLATLFTSPKYNNLIIVMKPRSLIKTSFS